MEVYRREVEGVRDDGDFDDHGREDERGQHRGVKELIVCLEGEYRAAAASHVERVEYLDHREREEGHRRPVVAVGELPCAAFHVVAYYVGYHDKHRDYGSLEKYVEAKAPKTTSPQALPPIITPAKIQYPTVGD